MKFTFSLEPVLKVRKHREKIQKQKLAEKLTEKKQLTERREKLKKKLEHCLVNAEQDEPESIRKLRRQSKYLQQIRRNMEELNMELKKVEGEVEEEREKLAAVHQKRHIMEKVKEKERREMAEKLAKREQKIMDEIATQTFSN
ncbi:flagellar export protein FliJ [Aliifodinibius sp. S!AR15-10]|uniref:flagellar export protein FliJ n=1 Tax=Aliifodinibius sp. S!AR15-10 TaxID=2950437 RepID=UPI00285B1626|nr:flagellar export protein FliJ [Aliifodinibius sp. S!AR15-10]MDR8394253.1 flagellar export protein FliJ [Aliifodinibius sp. S!AR15-10]